MPKSIPINSQSSLQIAQDKKSRIPKEYLQVAQGMEAQFINHMLQEMRKSIIQESPDSTAMNYYNSMMDHERAKIMTETNGGLGLQEVILQQIYPGYNSLQHDIKQRAKIYQEVARTTQGTLSNKENINE